MGTAMNGTTLTTAIKKAIIGLACLCLSAGPSWAGVSYKSSIEKEMSLAEAVLLAVRQNRSIKSAYLDRVVQKFSLSLAEATFDPKGTLSMTMGKEGGSDSSESESWSVTPSIALATPMGADFRFSWTNTTSHSSSDTASSSINATMTLPLLKGSGREVAEAPVTQARLNEQNNQLSLKSTLSNTVTQVIQAYRNLLLANEQLKINQRALKRSQDLVKINGVLIQSGRMARQELVQAEADLASREVSLANAENSLDNARLDLLGLLALDKYTHITPSEDFKLIDVDLVSDELTQIALTERPDIRQARISLKNLEVSKTLADDQARWQLDFVASTSTETSNNSYGLGMNGSPEDSWSAGLTISIPFMDESPKLAPLQARIALEKAELSLNDLEENIQREILNAVRDIRIKRRQVDLARQSLRLSEQKLKIEREKLHAGRTTNFQVVQFENDLVSAQNQELSAVINYLNALTNLDQSLGRTLDTWDIALEY